MTLSELLEKYLLLQAKYNKIPPWEDIQAAIFDEAGFDILGVFTELFDADSSKGEEAFESQEAIEDAFGFFVLAWSNLPHASLNGSSPNDKSRHYYDDSTIDESASKTPPKRKR
ncbi:MAG: hypothetical protein FWH40_03235 [Coriobacteriia bacterium]|nr:hypothetical protein [Coriobacteriia bacterium]